MSQTDVSPPATSPAPTPIENSAQTISPNQYHLHGGGLTVSYFPSGFGPLRPGGAGPKFSYQDSHHSLAFSGDDVRTVDVPDLGTVVSVTIVETIDVGNTTFSVLIPKVDLADRIGSSDPIRTEGITTIHRAFVALIGHAQAETYRVTPLSGTAVNGILPL
jgi:hypothetical protein